MVGGRQAAREARAQLLGAPDPKPPRKTSRGGGGASRVALWPAFQGWRRVNRVWGAKAVIREGEGERPTTVLTKVADRECGRRHHV